MRDVGLSAAIRAATKISNLAKAIGVTRAAVSQWERVPGSRVLDVERATGIPRHVLRPDIYPPHREAAA